MQHLFGSHIVKLRYSRWGRYRGRQPAEPALTGGGTTLVVLVRCLMSCNGQLWRPRGISPLFCSSTRFIVGLCLLIKTRTRPCLRVHHTTHSNAGPRLLVMPRSILFPPRTIPHLNSLAPSAVAAEATKEFRAHV